MNGETGLDPITYEVIRSRMVAIIEEMRVALQSVSGSPTVVEASDFFTGLFRPDGSFVSMGFQVTFAAPAVGTLIRHIGTNGPAVRDGDMFVANDPYIGALHQNDVQMAAPVFHQGELVGWAGVMAHETDVGGMDFASWSPKAREIYQEGLRIPAVKLVDEGEVREDVLEMILTASRLPAVLGLDLRAFIATLNVAKGRVRGLIDRYGFVSLEDSMDRMIEASEQKMRERLLELPDGVFRATDFIEHDGHEDHLYKVDVRLTKKDDRIELDFEGSSPQAPGFINATRAGLHGGVTGALLPTLGFDIPWNEGLLKPVEINAPDGLICTAQHPAPVGSATVEAVWSVSNAVAAVLNKLLACSPRYRTRAQAVSSGTMATFNLGGVNQFGEKFGLHLMDPLAGGCGAFATKDGIDAGGPINGPMPSIADVETNEQVSPLLYLYRRLAPDTAGAGKKRGGRSAEIALTLSGIESASALIMTHGLEVPNSAGLSGGAPGAPVRQRFGRRVLPEGRFPVDELPYDPETLGGEWDELGPKPGLIPMTNEDVFAVSWQGGGGWGDPLDREPEIVWQDIDDKIISLEAAEETYGVVASDGHLNAKATAERRRQLREERVGHSGEEAPAAGDEQARWPLGENLLVVENGEGWQVVSKGGHVLSTDATAWRAGAISKLFAMGGPQGPVSLHPDLALTAFYCPASGALLAVDLHQKDVAPHDDIILDLVSLEKLSKEAGDARQSRQLPM